MADMVKVRSVSVFYGSVEGRQIGMGDVFEVTADRLRELKANGLVEEAKAVAPEPETPPARPAARRA